MQYTHNIKKTVCELENPWKKHECVERNRTKPLNNHKFIFWNVYVNSKQNCIFVYV